MKKELLVASALSLTLGTALATSENVNSPQSSITATDTRATFEILDANQDGNLSRAEYEALTAVHGGIGSNNLEGSGHRSENIDQTGDAATGLSDTTPPGADADTTPGSADAGIEGSNPQ